MAESRRRLLLGDVPHAVRGTDEHRQALSRERQWARTSRSQLGQEARQHHLALEQIRDGAVRDRRLYRSALQENRWLLALADAILVRKNSRRVKTAA